MSGNGLLHRDRGDGEDPAPAALDHPGEGGAHEVHAGEEVRFERVAPLLGRRVLEPGRGRASGVRHQDVHLPEALLRGPDEPEGGVWVSDVHLVGEDLRPVTVPDLRGGAVEGVPAPCPDGDPGSFRGQCLGDRATEALTAGGDDGGAAGDTEIHRESALRVFVRLRRTVPV